MARLTQIDPEAHRQAVAAYRALNDSPMQRRLREEQRWFAAVVLWQPGDYDVDWIIRELRRIRELGFTCVRYHSARPTELAAGEYDFSRTDDWMNAAAEAGIGVIYHEEGFGRASDLALIKHGMTAEEFRASYLDDPQSIAVVRERLVPLYTRYREHPALYAWGVFGEPNSGDVALETDRERAQFADWLRAQYGTVEALDRAWNIYPERGKPIVPSFEEAWRAAAAFRQENALNTVAQGRLVYGAARDMIRFQTEKMLARTRNIIRLAREVDDVHPLFVGSHQLFINQPFLRWDTGEWARSGDLHFSSIHMSWHFEQVEGEVDRPVYLQARLTRDYFKDGWTSAYETTGGAVQYSGGYGNDMTPGLMRRLLLNYLAAGNLNVAFWTWNHRPGWTEAGEYGMTTYSGALTAWAQEAGKVIHGLAAYHGELWEAKHEAQVGVVENWDNEAIHLVEPERFDLREGPSRFSRGTKVQPWRALIGAGRAFTNQHIPFEYVTAHEIDEGIAAYYPVLYLPHMRAISAELMEKLIAYVHAGGRLIADVQVAFMDPWGKMHPTGPGGLQERAFGAYVDMIHDARTAAMSVNGMPVEGFFGDIVPTTARVIARFQDGRPAITEANIGRGSAVLIGFDAARMCWQPGQTGMEALIGALALHGTRAGWQCDAPMAFRLAGDAADHYFLLNDGPAKTALLEVYDRTYVSGLEVIDGTPIDVAGTIAIPLPAMSAVWARFVRE